MVLVFVYICLMVGEKVIPLYSLKSSSFVILHVQIFLHTYSCSNDCNNCFTLVYLFKKKSTSLYNFPPDVITD